MPTDGTGGRPRLGGWMAMPKWRLQVSAPPRRLRLAAGCRLLTLQNEAWAGFSMALIREPVAHLTYLAKRIAITTEEQSLQELSLLFQSAERLHGFQHYRNLCVPVRSTERSDT